MSQIKIDYDVELKEAHLSPSDDCPPRSWRAVRRFFESRYPDQIAIEATRVIVPWWAFLAERSFFRRLLRVNNITGIESSDAAKEQLALALERTREYQASSERREEFSEEEVEQLLLKAGFTRSLKKPYQIRNLRYLTGLRSAATFSVPGAGKTTEALAYFFATADANDRILVIAPKNAFVAWEDELPECIPSIDWNFQRLTGGRTCIRDTLSTKPKAIIISYHQLPMVLDLITQYLVENDVYVFIDESHRMKRGAEGVHGSSILSISHLPKRKLILSGTPLPNAIGDLVAQFRFLYPEANTDENHVRDDFQSVFVRTTKSELGLLPPQRILREVEMYEAQRNLYDSLAHDAARHLHGLTVVDRLRFRRISKIVQYMLQAASNPVLLLNSELAGHSLLSAAVSEGLSKKIEYACSLARKLVQEDKKVLIWSSFVGTVEHIAGLLSDVGAHFIHGGVETTDDPDVLDSREQKIREFNDPDSPCRVLVANPAACSEGISLHHVCHHAIYIDRTYNAAHYLQSEDRIHRIGLDEEQETYITILSSPNSIDQSVERRLAEKIRRMGEVLNDPNLSFTPLNLDRDTGIDELDADDIADLKEMLTV